MSQFPHDEFAKEYLPELIKDYGEAKSGENVIAERREDVRSAIRREKRKSRTPSFLETEPFLWILTPTLAKQKLELFAAKRPANWEDGIYFLPAGLSAGIVVIHQLPVTEETLWLRILGKGKVQENAIDELKALPKDYPHRDNVLELIGNLFAMLKVKKNQGEKLAREEQELIMKLSPIYLEKLEESKQIGIKEGLQQEANLLIVRLLRRKLGNLSPELEKQINSLPLKTLEDLGEALLDFNSVDEAIDWLKNH
jgi:hypothetical protein